MTHEELRDRLLDLACCELSPGDAREVEAHAAGCEACRAELAALRGTRRVMATLPVEPAPEQGERILVAAAREAVRARPPRRSWRRWLWAAPALASVAVVVLFSLRLGAVRPPDAAHEDPNALRGDAGYAAAVPGAAAPAAAAPAAAAPGVEPAAPPASGREEATATAPRAPRVRGEPAREAAKRAEVRDERALRPPQLATAPEAPAAAPATGGPRAEDERSAASNAAPAAVAGAPVPAAPPSPAPAAPPRRSALRAGSAGEPAADDLADREAAVSALAPSVPGEAPGSRAMGASPGQGAADAATGRDAAPARRAAKAVAAPDVSGAGAPRSPRERAVAAATVRARRLGLDPRGMAIGVEGPTTVDAWIAQFVAVAAPAELAGRRFWAVAFTPSGPRSHPALTVFVEDGSFQPLTELRGR
jgi:hypothetical protein